ncbi:MAG TPA: CinA family protein [Longilinea sp.]|nr:CinA family protein [Longilinea sp.]
METLLEIVIGNLLRQHRLKLAVAESCTGGLVGDRLTNIPGSSDYYLGSITAYAYEAKRRVLGVSAETLRNFGAVSRETAIEMARGVRSALVDETLPENVLGLSVTGIAGPGGGTLEKPVGLVWIGLSAPDGDWAWCYRWNNDRIGNKAASAQQALQQAVEYLTEK